MQVFNTKKTELIQIYSEDTAINALPAKSQILFLQKILAPLTFKKSDFPSNTIEKILLIGNELYRMRAEIHIHPKNSDAVRLKNIEFIKMSESDIVSEKENKIPEIEEKNISLEASTDQECENKDEVSETPKEDSESITKLTKQETTEKKVEPEKKGFFRKTARLFGSRSQNAMQFSCYFNNRYEELLEVEERAFEILDKNEITENQIFPYIYRIHDRYTVCLNNVIQIGFTNRLAAKLFLVFNEGEEKDQLIEMDKKENDFSRTILDLMKPLDTEMVSQILTHIQEPALLAKIQEERNETD